jgi:hypothetical protein
MYIFKTYHVCIFNLEENILKFIYVSISTPYETLWPYIKGISNIPVSDIYIALSNKKFENGVSLLVIIPNFVKVSNFMSVLLLIITEQGDEQVNA